VIGRHKFSVGKKFSTFIFGKFSVHGNIPRVEMGLKPVFHLAKFGRGAEFFFVISN
jgi:hypothetical protein